MTHVLKITLSLMIVASGLAVTATSIPQYGETIVALSVYGLVIQSSISTAIVLVVHASRLQNVVMAIWTTCGLFTAYAVFLLPTTGSIVMAILLVIVCVSVWTALVCVDKLRMKALLGSAVIIFVSGGGVMLGALSHPSLSETHTPPTIASMPFATTPDVYIIGMDGLPASNAIMETSGISHNPMQDVIDNRMRRMQNVFGAAITHYHYYRLFTLLHNPSYERRSVKYYERHTAEVVAGHAPTPLSAIFRKAGYYVTVGFHLASFGKLKGEYIDELNAPTGKHLFRCPVSDLALRWYTFWNYCVVVERLRKGLYNPEPAGQWLLQAIDKQPHAPELRVFHVWVPGHGIPWSSEEYNARFVSERRLEEGAALIDGILNSVADRDHPTIVLIMGDHGIKVVTDADASPREIVLNHLATIAAVWPPGRLRGRV